MKILATLFLLSLLSSPKLLAQDPGKGGTAAGFEVDADFKSGFIPAWWIGSGNNQNYFPNRTTFGADWSGAAAVLKQVGGVSVPGSSADRRAVWHVDGNWGGGSTVPEVVSFAGNSNKNGDNIALGQKPYSLQLGGSGPQKNDITNTYLYSKQDAAGHTWLFFGAETRATNGNSYIDFEYNQAGVTVSNTQLIGKGLVNGRTVGDFVLVVNYTGGGNRPVMGVRTWLASGNWSPELPVNSSQFMTTNSAAVDPVAPNRAFASDGSFANTVMALQFMEGGVDITALNIAELDLCTTGATVTIKTRSSSSFTAELKDLDVVPFALLPPAGLTDLTPVTKCPDVNESAAFTTTVSGDGANGANVEWYKDGVKIDQTNNGGGRYVITSTATTSTLTITGIVSGDGGTYKAVLTKASCGTPDKSATLTVNVTAALTDLSSQIKCESTTETPQSASFSTTASGTDASGANIEWYFGTTKLSNGTKYTIVVDGNKSTLTINGIVEADEGTYKAKLVNATCGAPEKSGTLTVNTTAALTNLDNQTKCPGAAETASFSTTVSGTGASASNVEWYFGTTKLTNSPKYTILVSGGISKLTINGIVEADEGTYKAKLVNATCGAPEKSGTLTVNPVPEANAGTAPDAQCYDANGNSFSLKGSGANGNPSWAVAPNGNPGNFTVQITNGTTYEPTVKVTTGTTGGTVTLRLTVTSDQTPSCGNKTSDVTVTILPQAAGPQVTYIAPTCLEATFKVTVDNPVSGSTYTLRQLSGGVGPLTKKAPDHVVNGKITFEGLTVGKGYRVTETNSAGCISAPNVCGDFSNVSGASVNNQSGGVVDQEITLTSVPKTNVTAAPNPFNDRIRFTLKSDVSGQGSLELYNTLGQRVKTVFQGQVKAGQVQTIEYAVPASQRTNLIYLFRVGDQRATGKLVGLKQ